MKRLTNLGRAGIQPVDLDQLWQDTITLIRAEFGEDLNLVLELRPLPDFAPTSDEKSVLAEAEGVESGKAFRAREVKAQLEWTIYRG